MALTDEQRKAQISALIFERKGYEAAGNKDRIAAVDAELTRLGANAAPPATRAKKATPKKASKL